VSLEGDTLKLDLNGILVYERKIVERCDRTLPGRDCQRQELGDSGKLRQDPAFALLDLGGQMVVADDHTGGEPDRTQEQRGQGAATAAEGADQGVRRRGGEPDQPPDDLLDAELVHGLVDRGAVEPAA
jgi:hypothetical protein